MKNKSNSKFIAAMLFTFSAAMLMPTQASAFDEDAAKDLAKENGCFKCHAIDKTKKASSYQKIAAKYKGKPVAEIEAKLMKHLTSGEKVKMEDGTEEDHKIIDTKDTGEQKNLVDWILAQ
jgi:cytochrome c